MTILIAARNSKENVIHLASDSMINNSVSKFKIWNKWTAFDNFYIWLTGDINAHLYIREYIYDELNKCTAETARDVVAIYKLIELWLEKEFQAKRTETSDRDYMDMWMIVVSNWWKIFHCSHYLNVTEEEQYWVEWSGSQLARWWLSLLQKMNKINSKNIILLMNSVIENDLYCWAPIHLTTLLKHEQVNI